MVRVTAVSYQVFLVLLVSGKLYAEEIKTDEGEKEENSTLISTSTERQAKRYSFNDDGLNDNSFQASNPSFIKELTFTTPAPKNSQLFHHDNIVLISDNSNAESSVPVVENYFNHDFPPYETNRSAYNKDQSPSAASLINQGYEGFTREAKDYTYSYPYPSASSSSSGSSGSFHNDPGTASYYYHSPQDDKNYWNTAPPAQDGKPGTQTMLECYPPSSGFFSELIRLGGIAKVSLVKALLIGVLALLVLKIPALLLLKALVFKVVVLPFALISIMLPVLLPLAYFFWPNLSMALGLATPKPPASPAGNATNATTVAPPGRRSFGTPWPVPDNLQEILNNFVQSERCLERIACKLGTRDSKSAYRKHVSWLLKKLQVSVDAPLRTKFKHYRDAYNLGASTKEDICDRGLFPCHIPKLLIRQSSRTYEIL
ncbi:uncharacterized protein LOC111044810 [Nilaparvata lugens]|uniref:uncharacterized protein LOC111044810 n=1 Tax=Nilaparvata lugens TaxID=108931 RepID=UPI00193D0F7E|nr:uncharacterized protein LOC111044810 [Nilaparvata lugens]